MERNRWEAAIRCLEIALHPNTTDDELIAAVNGFRRTADGTPLSDICRAFAAKHADIGGPTADEAGWRAMVDRLNRQNLDLRRRLKIEATGYSTAARQLQDAEGRVRELSEELLAARLRANGAEGRYADLRAAYAEISDRLNRPFAAARPVDTEPRTSTAASPFQKILTDARQRAHGAEKTVAQRAVADTPFSAPRQRAPWTA
jgi:chromosome segregation ATPase